jgi:hypothetical protein
MAVDVQAEMVALKAMTTVKLRARYAEVCGA